MSLPQTPQAAVALWFGLTLVLMFVLVVRISMLRRRNKIGMGDGGLEALGCAVRAHANLVEFALPVFLGLWMAIPLGAPANALHVMGGVFFVGRVFHAFGMSSGPGANLGRFVGAATSFLAVLLVGLGLVVHTLV